MKPWPKKIGESYFQEYADGHDTALSQCEECIEGITEEDLMEATYNTITQHDAIMIRSFLMQRIGK